MDYLVGAARALQSARLLFEAEDFDGAADRAYYAAHDAAIAALLSVNKDPAFFPPKTHKGLISLFSQSLEKDRGWNPKLSGLISQIERARLDADYEPEVIDGGAVARAIESASEFVEAVRVALSAM